MRLRILMLFIMVCFLSFACVENIITINLDPNGQSYFRFHSRGDSLDIFNDDFSHPKDSMINISTISIDNDNWSHVTEISFDDYYSNDKFPVRVLVENAQFMKKDSIFINISRGAIVKTNDLLKNDILKKFRGKKLGSALLQHAIKTSFHLKSDRIWVHTCSLDHKFALNNYKSKGFKIFRQEEIDFVA